MNEFHSKPTNVHLMVALEKKSEALKPEHVHPVEKANIRQIHPYWFNYSHSLEMKSVDHQNYIGGYMTGIHEYQNKLLCPSCRPNVTW